MVVVRMEAYLLSTVKNREPHACRSGDPNGPGGPQSSS